MGWFYYIIAKFSGYYFYMNTNISGDFEICISVPLNSGSKMPPSFSIFGLEIYKTIFTFKFNTLKFVKREFLIHTVNFDKGPSFSNSPCPLFWKVSVLFSVLFISMPPKRFEISNSPEIRSRSLYKNRFWHNFQDFLHHLCSCSLEIEDN